MGEIRGFSHEEPRTSNAARRPKAMGRRAEVRATRLGFTNGPSPTLRLKTVPSFLVPPLVPPNSQAEDGAAPVGGTVGPA